jgi:hypothetical protein
MKYLYFDIRALAIMRMCIAAVLMFDIAIRLTDLEVFYTDKGAVPLSMIFQHSWNEYFISVHTISGLFFIQLVLFALAFFFAVMLFLGYRTRLFTVLSWFMLLSLHNRNGLILQGGDDLLRLVLFWAIFIPWGKKYSCDSLLEKDTTYDQQIFTIATVAYLLQICYIYSGSALLKGSEWNTDYTALYYAYSLDQIAFPFSKLIYYYPELLKKLTFFVYYFELLIPLLFFIPFKHGLWRSLGVISIIVFHSFNSVSLLIGLFPAIGVATVVGILPTSFMDKMERLFGSLKLKVAISFRGYIQMINRFITWKRPRELSNFYIKNIVSAVLIFLIVFVFDWNFSNLSFVNSKLSDNLRFIGYGLRLDQSWGMFAPGVFKDDGWFVLEGTDQKGIKINLLRPDEELSYKKPEFVVNMFKNDRWRKYSENYIFGYNEFMRGYFCNYYLRKWNRNHPERQMDSLTVVYMKEFTLPDYQYSKPEQNRLWTCVKGN